MRESTMRHDASSDPGAGPRTYYTPTRGHCRMRTSMRHDALQNPGSEHKHIHRYNVCTRGEGEGEKWSDTAPPIQQERAAKAARPGTSRDSHVHPTGSGCRKAPTTDAGVAASAGHICQAGGAAARRTSTPQGDPKGTPPLQRGTTVLDHKAATILLGERWIHFSQAKASFIALSKVDTVKCSIADSIAKAAFLDRQSPVTETHGPNTERFGPKRPRRRPETGGRGGLHRGLQTNSRTLPIPGPTSTALRNFCDTRPSTTDLGRDTYHRRLHLCHLSGWTHTSVPRASRCQPLDLNTIVSVPHQYSTTRLD
jgi:hypothetical protein